MNEPTSDIPVPNIRCGPPGKYRFHTIEVGQSVFESPIPGVTQASLITRVRSSANHIAATYGKKFVTRKEGDGVRVWRTK